MRVLPRWCLVLAVLGSWFLASGVARAALTPEPLDNRRVSDITNTKHNLGTTAPATDNRTVKANVGETTEVCVFCHTPHASTLDTGAGGGDLAKAPLWNRALNTTPGLYTPYNSRSIQANIDANPGGASKLCLSCHDGTLAVDSVNVLEGQANGTIAMTGLDVGGTMPGGPQGATSGFTRRLGTDLRNDHPISVTYDSQLAKLPSSPECLNPANCDGEMFDPALEAHIGNRAPGVRPDVPLEAGKVQCTSCHDPHLRGASSELNENIKFLRLNRFQLSSPPAASFDRDNDIVCLSCHDKAGWEDNAHARSETANEEYLAAPAQLRDFPSTIQVWQAGCLNCHDTHTVPGARRLLREGVEGAITFQSGQYKTSGASAIEETCYQCHTTSARTILSATSNQVPNIESDFTDPGNKHMPITTQDQQASSEVHDIKDADFTEDRADLGETLAENRHVECTDCHNPHRVMKARRFNMDPDVNTGNDVAAGTHDVSASATPSNIASGVLRGAWGVEPDYCTPSSTLPTFNANLVETNSCISYEVKQGDFSVVGGGSTAVSEPYVTREYQICLKCHSNYGFGINPPALGDSGGGTAYNTNSVTTLTNQAMEFRPADPGQPTNATNTGAISAYQTTGSYSGSTGSSGNFNHRSWHPVMAATGRTGQLRGNTLNGGNGSNISGNWFPPFSNGVGTQTMYCSDCHGNNTANGSIVPATGNPWGPHGSTNNFILKGSWTPGNAPGSVGTDAICFKCHRPNIYRTANGTRTGFWDASGSRDDLHGYHYEKLGNMSCNWCHVSVPHGWKNKAFLVNLNDVGEEASGFGDTNGDGEVCAESTGNRGWDCARDTGYTDGPYYVRSFLKVRRFAPSGRWEENDCGSRNDPDGGDGIGKTWMTANTCSAPN